MKTTLKTRSPWIDRLVLAALWTAAIVFLGCLCASAGCRSAEATAAIADAQTKQAQIQAKAIVDAANAKAKADAATAKAKADTDAANAKAAGSPANHPVQSANQTVKRLRGPLIFVAFISFILFVVSWALKSRALSLITKITIPVFGELAAFSFVGAITLPFLPWVIYAAVGIGVGLFVYEWIHLKSLKAAAQAIEEDFGFGSIAPSSVTGTLKAVESTVTSTLQTIEKAGTSAAPIAVTTTT